MKNKFGKVVDKFEISREQAAKFLNRSVTSISVMKSCGYRISKQSQDEKICRLLREYDGWLCQQREKVRQYLSDNE
jgi:hypothetical protein